MKNGFTIGAAGLAVLAAGVALDLVEANTESLCSTYTPGFGRRPPYPFPNPSECRAANLWSGVGDVLMILAGVTLVVVIVSFVRWKRRQRPKVLVWGDEAPPTAAPPGWYKAGHVGGGWCYWDGMAWRPDVGPDG